MKLGCQAFHSHTCLRFDVCLRNGNTTRLCLISPHHPTYVSETIIRHAFRKANKKPQRFRL